MDLQTGNFIKKETPTQVFSCDFFEIFKSAYFGEQLRTTASGDYKKWTESMQKLGTTFSWTPDPCSGSHYPVVFLRPRAQLLLIGLQPPTPDSVTFLQSWLLLPVHVPSLQPPVSRPVTFSQLCLLLLFTFPFQTTFLISFL